MTKRTNTKTLSGATVTAAAALTAAQSARALGANERVRLGFIGVANRGGQLLDAFLTHKDIEVAALCDVHKPTMEKANARVEGKARLYGDFRKLLEAKDVDAVVIATPDHWHAIQMIAACEAGKDVYVEKPLSITIYEGRRMVEAARRTKRVVQVGTHMRACNLYADLARAMQAGKVGKVTVSRAYRLSNMWPAGIGKARPTAPPEGLDWDSWLGPRPADPFRATIAPYKFRWWDLYSSQAANWGVHYLDLIRWMTGELAPSSICALGGKYAIDDDRTIPDTLQITYEFTSGRLAMFGQYEASGNPATLNADIELRGTLGTVHLSYLGGIYYRIVPEQGGQFQERKPRVKPEEARHKEGDLTANHARDFLDCIKSRQRPRADIEIGHRSTTFSLLANISLATKLRIDWDPERERITNHAQANELLHYEYRKPWKLE